MRPLNCGEKMDVTLFESHNCDDDNKEFGNCGVCRPNPEMVDGRPSTSQQCRMKTPSPINATVGGDAIAEVYGASDCFVRCERADVANEVSRGTAVK